MATEPSPVKVRRVAVLLEMEDGSTFAAYAEPDPARNYLEVELGPAGWEPPTDWTPANGWEPPPLVTNIRIDGLQEYRVATDMPAMIGATLDAIRNAVNL